MFRKCLLGCLLISSAIFANQMQQSFNEGMATGKSNSGAAQNAVKGFNPSEIKGYQANPEQSKYYTGIMGDNPNISALGMQELSNSELGKTIRESTVNNPKDNISMDSDIIRNSDEIKKNANIISGIANSKQCVKQVMGKTNFTYHYCEKDQAINKVCRKTANVVWEGKREVKDEWIKANVSFQHLWGKSNFYVDVPDNVSVIGYEVEIKHEKYHWAFNSYLNMRFITNDEINIKRKYSTPRTAIYKKENILIHSNEHKRLTGSLYPTGQGSGRVFGIHGKLTNKTVLVKLKIRKEIDSLNPKIEWGYSCPNLNDENLIKIGEKCTQAGGTRNFFKDGKNVQLHSDCWEIQTEYLVSEASDNECKKYDSNPNCTVGERECLDSVGEYCTRFRLKYQCQHTTRTDGIVCGDKFFCSDGSCADLEGNVNTDFGHAVSQLATLAQAGKDVALNPDSLKAFSGKAMFCRKTGFGFSNCCKDSGWGHKAGLAQCNSEENALGKAKEKNLVIYTGTYCDKKVLGKCIRKKSSYCVFDNKLARIIQYQGRSGQLGVGFGGAQSPNCRGLSVDELQRIDFNAMDYSDFYDELNSNTKLPDQNQLIDYMKKTITDQLKQE